MTTGYLAFEVIIKGQVDLPESSFAKRPKNTILPDFFRVRFVCWHPLGVCVGGPGFLIPSLGREEIFLRWRTVGGA